MGAFDNFATRGTSSVPMQLARSAQPVPFNQRAEVLATCLPDPAPLDIGFRDQPDGGGVIITLRAAAYNTSSPA